MMSTIEHIAAGKAMQGAYLRALHLETFFINRYGRQARATKEMRKALKQILYAKSELDDLFFQEHKNAERSPYFGDHFPE